MCCLQRVACCRRSSTPFGQSSRRDCRKACSEKIALKTLNWTLFRFTTHPKPSIISNMNNTYDMEETSEISNISTAQEAQAYVESFARGMLPEALEKLRGALSIASKPKDIADLVEQIRSYAQVRKTSDNAQVAAASVLGAAISGTSIANAFSAIGQAFGVEADIESLRDVSEDLEIMEKEYEVDESEEVEKVETLEILEKKEISYEDQAEVNPFEFD